MQPMSEDGGIISSGVRTELTGWSPPSRQRVERGERDVGSSHSCDHTLSHAVNATSPPSFFTHLHTAHARKLHRTALPPPATPFAIPHLHAAEPTKVHCACDN